MQKLLGHLAQFGSFSAQGEVLCTQGLAYLLRVAQARSAIKAEIEARTGMTIDDHLTWIAEARHDGDRGRPDLEARTPAGIPRVMIEAKLGAVLSGAQLRSYVAGLNTRSPEGGVLVVLVPRRRTTEAVTVVASAFGAADAQAWRPLTQPNVAVFVLSWEDLLPALKQAGPESLRSEAEQLEAMYKVLNGDDILPLASSEDLINWRSRESDFINLFDRVSRRLTTRPKVYPVAIEPLEHVPDGLEPKGYRRRYIFKPLGTFKTHFSLGVRDPFAGHSTPVWMRFNKRTPGFVVVHARLGSSQLKAKLVESGGHVWIPLDVPLGVSGDEMVGALVAQAEAVLQVVYQPST